MKNFFKQVEKWERQALGHLQAAGWGRWIHPNLEAGVVTVTQVSRDNESALYTVVATADADTVTGNIAHGLGVVPRRITITALLQAPAALSEWAATTIDVTNVELTKGTGAGSGNAGAQIRLLIER